MSYQAYLDTIQAKTGLTPDDFRRLAQEKGLREPGVKAGEIVAWLKADYGLGHGHAMAIVLLLREASGPRRSVDEKMDSLFGHGRSNWRETYDRIIQKVAEFGPDVQPDPTDSYISLLKGNQKFAVIGVTAIRMDIGLKLKGVEPQGRLEAAGAWNSMVTHRVRITEPEQVDQEVYAWLKQAHDAA